jgi:hypothetical protein
MIAEIKAPIIEQMKSLPDPKTADLKEFENWGKKFVELMVGDIEGHRIDRRG